MTTTLDTYQQSVVDYFQKKADEYDLVDEQLYWVLSDALLWTVLEREVIRHLPPSFRFLDAGGGTGRWSLRILEACPESAGLLYDLSKDMSAKARAKTEALGISHRLGIINGRLENVEKYLCGGHSYDLIFNFHNVLGFVEDPQDVLDQLSRLLNPGGLLVSFVPNRYHTMFFNILQSRIDEAEHVASTRRGRFTTDMPMMHVFSPGQLRYLYDSVGLLPLLITGFPSLIYPGMQETQLRGQTQTLADVLSDAERFDRIFRLEKEMLNETSVASRGNNLFIVGRKG